MRGCAWPGCACEGAYRAPRSRDELRVFIYLCLDHIREYNKRWDYFAGMSAEAIEAHRRDDVTWHRPTWEMGTKSGWQGPNGRFRDPFDILGEHGAPPEPPRPLGRAAEMMAVLELAHGFTLIELKSRYKTMAKRHHPDLNGGDRRAEERFKRVTEAYRYLLDNRHYS